MIVYKTTNITTGKMYIGSTSRTFKKAIDDGYLGSSEDLQKDINKLGPDKFLFEVIERCKSLTHARERERHYHDLNDVAKSDMYYNKKHGHFGATGHKYSGDQSRNLSKAQKGIKRKPTTCKLLSNKQKGIIPTELSKAKQRLAKAKKCVREAKCIRKRGNSWSLRLRIYGSDVDYTYGPSHNFESVRQSLRDHMRPVIKMYEEDVKRMETDKMIENLDNEITIIPYTKPVLSQKGFTANRSRKHTYIAQYASDRFGKMKLDYLGVFDSKFAARLAVLKHWNRVEKIDYKNSELMDQNIEFFKQLK